MKYLLYGLFFISFFVWSEGESKIGILPRDLPPELQKKDSVQENIRPQIRPQNPQYKEPSSNNESQKDEVLPLIPEESHSSQEFFQNSKGSSRPSENLQAQPEEVNFQNIYSTPIIIEENKKNPEDFVEEYNNFLIESAPVYQKVQKGFLNSQKYRLGVSGDITPYRRDSSYDLFLMDLKAQFGWVFSNFEIGPFVSFDLEYRFASVGYGSFEEADVIVGGFAEYNFTSRFHKKQLIHPSLGLQLGYNREISHNRLYIRPYVVAKTFLTESVALSLDLGFDWRTSLSYVIEDIWSLNTNIGFLTYF